MKVALAARLVQEVSPATKPPSPRCGGLIMEET
jgi:hypothetical protein